jgi:hypothetical protein
LKSVDRKSHVLQEAIDFCKQFGVRWRLPTIKELPYAWLPDGTCANCDMTRTEAGYYGYKSKTCHGGNVMPLPEKFFDIDGKEVSLSRLCEIEPEWAANRIRYLTNELDKANAIIQDRNREVKEC